MQMSFFRPKILSSFKEYKANDYLSDIIAGIIVAIIALPLSIALAIASGATPETGLYTAIIAGFITALLGGSRVNITGPTAAFATIGTRIPSSRSYSRARCFIRSMTEFCASRRGRGYS